MKITVLLVVAGVLGLAVSATNAQEQQSLASTLDVYAFPKEGQEASQQSMDEAECYEWAVGNTGSDPFDLLDQAEMDEQLAEAEQEAAEQTGRGSGARGAVRGAAAGAVVGEIVDDDASQGAAYGAAAGAIRGRRQGRRANAEAQEQAAEQAETREAATAEDMDNFKKAFSVCLEAKDYLVKY